MCHVELMRRRIKTAELGDMLNQLVLPIVQTCSTATCHKQHLSEIRMGHILCRYLGISCAFREATEEYTGACKAATLGDRSIAITIPVSHF
ncbi:hypothetical protein DACRYDRAFT_22401 [Dacryopinax primogenitus]|uniref:Uncharacterized protein n=1 Tax=Dacryopinax primogenitus (strain DJM 731) TaxID=1858805 RepID=M5FZR2_DACPD|nr:uncharacterized protein DACRYDRAFT_22401 [Dacryopinax primogenitus]EJU01999.1 hypothetical protein DACRYDRAFT_22401 [Dacryopinax primogenitus]